MSGEAVSPVESSKFLSGGAENEGERPAEVLGDSQRPWRSAGPAVLSTIPIMASKLEFNWSSQHCSSALIV
jgi:hypothetical protein